MSETVILILMGVGALIAIWFVLEVVVGIPLLILVKRAEGKAHDREVAVRQMIALETLAVQQAALPVVAPQQTPLPVVPEPEPGLKVDLTLPARVATALADLPEMTAKMMADERKWMLEGIANSEEDKREYPEDAADHDKDIEIGLAELKKHDEKIIAEWRDMLALTDLPRDFVLQVLKAHEAEAKYAPGILNHEPPLTTEELNEAGWLEEDETAEEYYRSYWEEQLEGFYEPPTADQKAFNYRTCLEDAEKHGIPLPGLADAE